MLIYQQVVNNGNLFEKGFREITLSMKRLSSIEYFLGRKSDDSKNTARQNQCFIQPLHYPLFRRHNNI